MNYLWFGLAITVVSAAAYLLLAKIFAVAATLACPDMMECDVNGKPPVLAKLARIVLLIGVPICCYYALATRLSLQVGPADFACSFIVGVVLNLVSQQVSFEGRGVIDAIQDVANKPLSGCRHKQESDPWKDYQDSDCGACSGGPD
jgi:hypothetical protein